MWRGWIQASTFPVVANRGPGGVARLDLASNGVTANGTASVAPLAHALDPKEERPVQSDRCFPSGDHAVGKGATGSVRGVGSAT